MSARDELRSAERQRTTNPLSEPGYPRGVPNEMTDGCEELAWDADADLRSAAMGR